MPGSQEPTERSRHAIKQIKHEVLERLGSFKKQTFDNAIPRECKLLWLEGSEYHHGRLLVISPRDGIDHITASLSRTSPWEITYQVLATKRRLTVDDLRDHLSKGGKLDHPLDKAVRDTRNAENSLTTLIKWYFMCYHEVDVTEGDCAAFAATLKATVQSISLNGLPDRRERRRHPMALPPPKQADDSNDTEVSQINRQLVASNLWGCLPSESEFREQVVNVVRKGCARKSLYIGQARDNTDLHVCLQIESSAFSIFAGKVKIDHGTESQHIDPQRLVHPFDKICPVEHKWGNAQNTRFYLLLRYLFVRHKVTSRPLFSDVPNYEESVIAAVRHIDDHHRGRENAQLGPSQPEKAVQEQGVDLSENCTNISEGGSPDSSPVAYEAAVATLSNGFDDISTSPSSTAVVDQSLSTSESPRVEVSLGDYNDTPVIRPEGNAVTASPTVALTDHRSEPIKVSQYIEPIPLMAYSKEMLKKIKPVKLSRQDSPVGCSRYVFRLDEEEQWPRIYACLQTDCEDPQIKFFKQKDEDSVFKSVIHRSVPRHVRNIMRRPFSQALSLNERDDDHDDTSRLQLLCWYLFASTGIAPETVISRTQDYKQRLCDMFAFMYEREPKSDARLLGIFHPSPGGRPRNDSPDNNSDLEAVESTVSRASNAPMHPLMGRLRKGRLSDLSRLMPSTSELLQSNRTLQDSALESADHNVECQDSAPTTEVTPGGCSSNIGLSLSGATEAAALNTTSSITSGECRCNTSNMADTREGSVVGLHVRGGGTLAVDVLEDESSPAMELVTIRRNPSYESTDQNCSGSRIQPNLESGESHGTKRSAEDPQQLCPQALAKRRQNEDIAKLKRMRSERRARAMAEQQAEEEEHLKEIAKIQEMDAMEYMKQREEQLAGKSLRSMMEELRQDQKELDLKVKKRQEREQRIQKLQLEIDTEAHEIAEDKPKEDALRAKIKEQQKAIKIARKRQFGVQES